MRTATGTGGRTEEAMIVSGKRNRFIEWLVVVAVMAVVIAWLLPVRPLPYREDPQSKALAKVMKVAVACTLYAEQHNGIYPKEIGDIPLHLLPKKLRCYQDPKSGTTSEWVYLPRAGEVKKPQLLIVAPALFKLNSKAGGDTEKWRAVGFSDGHGERMPQSKYERLIRGLQEDVPDPRKEPGK